MNAYDELKRDLLAGDLLGNVISSDAARMARNAIQRGWTRPRMVETAAELRAEPNGTILRDEDGMVGVIASDPDGSGFRYVLAVGDLHPYTFASWAVSPSAVLFTPGGEG